MLFHSSRRSGVTLRESFTHTEVFNVGPVQDESDRTVFRYDGNGARVIDRSKPREPCPVIFGLPLRAEYHYLVYRVVRLYINRIDGSAPVDFTAIPFD